MAPNDTRRATIGQNLLIVRETRSHYFPDELFDEHAWNMLLHVFCALVANETLSEATLMRRADIGTGIGRRWLRYLVADGQIFSRVDGEDVVLTAKGTTQMRAFLDATDNIQQLI